MAKNVKIKHIVDSISNVDINQIAITSAENEGFASQLFGYKTSDGNTHELVPNDQKHLFESMSNGNNYSYNIGATGAETYANFKAVYDTVKPLASSNNVINILMREGLHTVPEATSFELDTPYINLIGSGLSSCNVRGRAVTSVDITLAKTVFSGNATVSGSILITALNTIMMGIHCEGASPVGGALVSQTAYSETEGNIFIGCSTDVNGFAVLVPNVSFYKDCNFLGNFACQATAGNIGGIVDNCTCASGGFIDGATTLSLVVNNSSFVQSDIQVSTSLANVAFRDCEFYNSTGDIYDITSGNIQAIFDRCTFTCESLFKTATPSDANVFLNNCILTGLTDTVNIGAFGKIDGGIILSSATSVIKVGNQINLIKNVAFNYGVSTGIVIDSDETTFATPLNITNNIFACPSGTAINSAIDYVGSNTINGELLFKDVNTTNETALASSDNPVLNSTDKSIFGGINQALIASGGTDAEKFWTKDIEEPATSIADNNKVYTAKWLQNLVKYSEDLSQSVWSKSSGITISGTDGVITPAVAGNHRIYVPSFANDTGKLKINFRIKAGNTNWLIVYRSGDNFQIGIDLVNGVFGGTITGIDKYIIVDVDGSFWDVSLELTTAFTGSGVNFYASDNGSSLVSTGDGTTPAFYLTRVQINNSEIIDNLDYVQTFATAESGRTEYKLTANSENSEDKDYISKSFYLNGEASGTIGLFVTSPVSVGNPSGALPLTSPYDMLQNNSVAPFIVPVDTVVTKIYLEVVRAAVSGATVGGAPTVRIDFYTHQPATRTLLFTKRVPCTENTASIGIYNNLSGAGSSIIFELVVNEDLPKNTLIGWEFVNESGSDAINAVSGVFGTIRGYINE